MPSGKLALEAAGIEPSDLVLLDIRMPGMDGFEVCRRLQEDAALREIPVLFIGALADVAGKLEAFSVGGLDYIAKLFQFEEVHARVKEHLELRRQKVEPRGNSARLSALEKLRDDLVHMVDHDLRSPLSALCAFLRILGDDPKALLPAEAQNDLGEALSAAGKMAGMVSGTLDVSKMEAGRLVPALSESDLVALASEVARGLGSLGGERALSVEPAQEAVTAWVDRELVSRGLQNLLANALRSTKGARQHPSRDRGR